MGFRINQYKPLGDALSILRSFPAKISAGAAADKTAFPRVGLMLVVRRFQFVRIRLG
jgi:hypothetical protein